MDTPAVTATMGCVLGVIPGGQPMSASPEDNQELGLKVTGAGLAGVFTGGTLPTSLQHRPQRTPQLGAEWGSAGHKR